MSTLIKKKKKLRLPDGWVIKINLIAFLGLLPLWQREKVKLAILIVANVFNYLLCTRHYSEYFICKNMVNFRGNYLRLLLILIL